MTALSARSHQIHTRADSWQEIWEAGPYYDRLSELLEDAQHYAVFAGWQIDSRLPLLRPARGGQPKGLETLKQKLERVCESKPGFRIFVLMWDHSYLYLAERELWQGRIWEDVHPRVHVVFDNRNAWLGAHHEKVALFDGQTALCGGIDLCADRWDVPEHRYTDRRRSLDRRREEHGPYHDLAVEVSGAVCVDLERHLATRWRALSSVPFPQTAKGLTTGSEGGRSVYLSRTIAGPPHSVREIEFLFRDLIRSARERIILEGQYFWSSRLVDLLVAQMLEHRVEVVLILAELAEISSPTGLMAPYEAQLIARLQRAAETSGAKLTVGMPYVDPPPTSKGREPKPVYVHSKLVIIDDRYLSIGSANFADRAMRIDTEVNLTLEARDASERAHIRRVAHRALDHWRTPGHSLRLADLNSHGSPRFKAFFDPEIAPGFALAHGLRRLRANRRALWALGHALVRLLPAALIIAWVGGEPGWQAFYALMLSTAWATALPFVPTMLAAALVLGPEIGPRVATLSLWVCAIAGYCVGRWGGRDAPKGRGSETLRDPKIRATLGRRDFGSVVRLLADPLMSLKLKLENQGRTCIPLPWFVLGTCIALASACWVACLWTAQFAPVSWIEFSREYAAAWAGVILAWTAIRSVLQAQKGQSHG